MKVGQLFMKGQYVGHFAANADPINFEKIVDKSNMGQFKIFGTPQKKISKIQIRFNEFKNLVMD